MTKTVQYKFFERSPMVMQNWCFSHSFVLGREKSRQSVSCCTWARVDKSRMLPAHNCGPPQRWRWTKFWRRFSTNNKTAAHKRRKEESRYWRWRRVCPRRQAVLLNEKKDALRRTGYVSACPHIPLPHCLRWPGVYLSRRRRNSVHLMKIAWMNARKQWSSLEGNLLFQGLQRTYW